MSWEGVRETRHTEVLLFARAWHGCVSAEAAQQLMVTSSHTDLRAASRAACLCADQCLLCVCAWVGRRLC